jgi:NAD(P)-dependent dehydrogenase (short-subunit alcohol dehydrogenase family)
MVATEPMGSPTPMNLVITGSSSGIGRFLAESLAKRGHEICRIARSPQSGFSFQCDVSNWNALQNCAEKVAANWQVVDALICCAGTQEPIGPAMEIDPAAWRSSLGVNLDGTFFSIRAFYPSLRRARRRAKVICFSGGGSTGPRPNFVAYGVAKTGVVRLVETLAAEWENVSVDVNAIAPGAIFTPMTEQVLARGEKLAGKKEFNSASKLSRDSAAKLEKVLGLVEFLLSENGDGISGKLISAPWDPWETLEQFKTDLKTDIYTLRRIVPKDRGKNWGDK